MSMTLLLEKEVPHYNHQRASLFINSWSLLSEEYRFIGLITLPSSNKYIFIELFYEEIVKIS
jgi:hypothetical protein